MTETLRAAPSARDPAQPWDAFVAETETLTSGVARRYASALFELALEENALDDVARDMETVGSLIDESADFRRLIESPVFGVDEQTRAVDAVFGNLEIGALATKFVKVAARNRRLFALPGIVKAFATLVAAHRGEVVAEVTSAEPLSDTHETALAEALSEASGKTVKLRKRVDPALIGGLVVRLGSRMIDTSLRTKLDGLRTAMKEAG
jgi:F-type H+-transporting ATPase subunit delta